MAERKDGPPDFSRDVDDYLQALWMLSLALLLAADDSQLARVLEANGNPGRDALYDRLAATGRPGGRIATKAAHARPFQTLVDALDAQGGCPGQAHPDVSERMVQEPRQRLLARFARGDDAGYFGYWSFELAAAMKVFGLDDSSCAGNHHYPRDLVGAFPPP